MGQVMGIYAFEDNKIKRLTTIVIIVCVLVIGFCIVLTSLPVEIREPLPAGSVNETDYYNADYKDYFMVDRSAAEEGLKHFYDKTGIQPYIYFTIKINGSDAIPSARDLTAYARVLYPQLFTDESHLLIVFYYNYPKDAYRYYILSGSNAESVMDTEAEKILSDYIDFYYNQPLLSLDKIFSDSFSHAADRLMSVTPSSWITVLIVLGVLIILIMLFLLFRAIDKCKKIRAQQNEEILGMPLEQYGKVFADSAETIQGPGAATSQEALVKRLMDDNAAEIAKYMDLARQALQAGKEDEAWIFVDKKQNLEVSRVAVNTAYASIVNTRRARTFTPKDEAEALAEKYAAQGRIASAQKSKNSARTKASVDEEVAKIKSDMGL